MALTKVQTIGIETGISLTGVTTVTTLNASTDTLSVGGTVNFGGNVSIAGTLTYEDVTNIDSVGLITARNGIKVDDLGVQVGTGATVDSAAANTLTFLTNGSERLRITSGGNVGIGTLSPSYVLHAVGTIAANDSGSNTDIRLIPGNGQASYSINNNAGQHIFVSGANERMRIDSSGRLLVGASSSRNVGYGGEGSLQLEGTGYQQASISNVLNSNDADGPSINFAKSRGTSNGSSTVVQDNDKLGVINFSAGDGTDILSAGVRITCEVDGTPGSNDMPGRLIVATTNDGAASPTERLRIDSAGDVLIGTTSGAGNRLYVVDSFTDSFVNPSDAVLRVENANTSGTTTQTSISFTSKTSSTNADSAIVSQAEDASGNASLQFWTDTSNGMTEKMRITSAGFLGLNTSAPATDLHISGSSPHIDLGPQGSNLSKIGFASLNMYLGTTSSGGEFFFKNNVSSTDHPQSSGTVLAKLTSGAAFIVGKTTSGVSGRGGELRDGDADYAVVATSDGHTPFIVNRNTNDGNLVIFRQANSEEGTISVSGSTVSYNGAHLSRWSQLAGGAERTEILRGSVLSNLDEMCEWGEEDNEQLNRMKVSDVEGDPKVAGVFQAWDDDDDTYTNDFYCAMTGDFVIRIAQGTTVANGDLLMSAGDGTAKPQGDGYIQDKTIAKVTSTTVATTYSDGSYCVPCVLMAC